MATNRKEPIFIQERKANYWRGFRAAFILMFAIIGLSVTIYYATQKPCQEYYVCDPANLCCGIER